MNHHNPLSSIGLYLINTTLPQKSGLTALLFI